MSSKYHNDDDPVNSPYFDEHQVKQAEADAFEHETLTCANSHNVPVQIQANQNLYDGRFLEARATGLQVQIPEPPTWTPWTTSPHSLLPNDELWSTFASPVSTMAPFPNSHSVPHQTQANHWNTHGYIPEALDSKGTGSGHSHNPLYVRIPESNHAPPQTPSTGASATSPYSATSLPWNWPTPGTSVSDFSSPTSPNGGMPLNPRIGTDATHSSSFKRRNRPPKFYCNVLGCGQDFTAAHNLRSTSS
ncbi:hypothetical protein VKT23_003469 [Stygiomarasmius scandens]|uniref:C2H2-type domain-containing protein n=1 Tax=Marasmiellus scandens TaxID=2682957 RepID=A0ABR1JXS2_9AGAR